MIKSYADIDKNDLRGLVRRLDDLGRILIPKEYRRELGLERDDKVELYALKDGVLIRLWDGESVAPVRRVDALGRLIVPVKMRRALDIRFHDELEIFLLRDGIFIRKKLV